MHEAADEEARIVEELLGGRIHMGQQLDAVLSSKAVPTSKDRGRDVLAFDFANLGWHNRVEAADRVPPGMGTTKEVDHGQVGKIFLKHDHCLQSEEEQH